MKKKRLEAALLALTTLLSSTGCTVTVDGHKIEFSKEEAIKTLEEFLGNHTSDENSEELENQETTTTAPVTTQYIAETTQTSTYTTVVGSIAQTTQATQATQPTTTVTTVATTTIPETTQTTTVTTPAPRPLNEIVETRIYSPNEYRISYENCGLTIGSEEFPTVYRMALKYLPADKNRNNPSDVSDFVKEIQEINKDCKYLVGDKVYVPTMVIYYTGTASVAEIASELDTPVEEICKQNGINLENASSISNQARCIVARILPRNTTKIDRSDGYKTYLYANTITTASKLVEVEKTCSNTATKAAFAIYNEPEDKNTCVFIQYNPDGAYVACQVAKNIENAYSIDGIPLIESRNVLLGRVEDVVGNPYNSTIITTTQIESFNFYKKNGKEYFTFYNGPELEEKGYVPAPELMNYFDTLNDTLNRAQQTNHQGRPKVLRRY